MRALCLFGLFIKDIGYFHNIISEYEKKIYMFCSMFFKKKALSLQREKKKICITVLQNVEDKKRGKNNEKEFERTDYDVAVPHQALPCNGQWCHVSVAERKASEVADATVNGKKRVNFDIYSEGSGRLAAPLGF